MSRGGARPGAGRKTNAEIAQVRELIDSVASPEEWKAVFANLFDIAKTNKGYPAVQAAGLLCRYRFGVPVQQEQPEPEVIMGPIQFIEVDPNPAVRADGFAEDADGFAEEAPLPENAPEPQADPDPEPEPSNGSRQAARLGPPSDRRSPICNRAAVGGEQCPSPRVLQRGEIRNSQPAEPPQLSAEETERRQRRAHRLHMRHLASL